MSSDPSSQTDQTLAEQLNPQTEVERQAVQDADTYAEAQRLVTQYRQEGLPEDGTTPRRPGGGPPSGSETIQEQGQPEESGGNTSVGRETRIRARVAVAEQNPDLFGPGRFDRSDINVTRDIDTGQVEVGLSGPAVAEQRREEALSQIAQQVDGPINPANFDVSQSDGQLQIERTGNLDVGVLPGETTQQQDQDSTDSGQPQQGPDIPQPVWGRQQNNTQTGTNQPDSGPPTPSNTGVQGVGDVARQQDQTQDTQPQTQPTQTGTQGPGETAQELDPLREAEQIGEGVVEGVTETGQGVVETIEQAVPFDPSELQQDRQRPQGRGLTDPSVNNPDFGEGTTLPDIVSGVGEATVEGAGQLDEAIAGPPGDVESAIGDVAFGAADPIIGPPGQTERLVRASGELALIGAEEVAEETGASRIDWSERLPELPGEVVEQTGAGFGDLAEGIGDVTSPVSDPVADVGGDILGGAADVTSPVLDPAADVTGDIVGGTADIVSDVAGTTADVTTEAGEQVVDVTTEVGESVLGPAGEVEQAVGGFVEETAQPIIGSPGELEQDITETTADIAGPVLEPIIGAPGATESALGDVAFDVGETSQEAADTVSGPLQAGAQATLTTLNLPGIIGFETAEDITGEEAFGDAASQAQQNLEAFGSGVGGSLAQGTVGLPSEGVQLGNLAATGAEFATTQIAEEGVVPGAEESALAAGTFGLAVGSGLAEEAAENPARFSGQLGTDLALGFGAGRVIQRAPSAVREARLRGQGADIFDVEPDLADPPTRTAGLELPGFTREAQADPDVARQEFLEQAQQNVLAGDEPVAFSVRGREAVSEFGGFGRNVEAPEGASEIPGLFQSADLSNLRLPDVSGGGFSIGFPRPRFTEARVLGERDIDVDIAEGQTTGEVGEFIAEEADRTQSFIRGGDVTPEQEVIAPPGSRFTESGGLFGVRQGGIDIPGTDITLGGNIVTGRLTRRVDPDGDRPDVDIDDTRTRSDIADETRRALDELRGQNQPDNPFFPNLPDSRRVTDSDGQTRDGTTEPPERRQPPTDIDRTPPTPEDSFTPTRPDDIFTPTQPDDIFTPTQPDDSGTPTRPTPSDPTDPSRGESTPRPPTLSDPTRGGGPSDPSGTSPPSRGGPTPSTGFFGYSPTSTGTGTGTQPRLPFDLNTDEDRDEFPDVQPAGQEFVNPIASGAQVLFGGGGATEASANLLPVSQDESGQPTGEVAPLSERGRQALDSDPFGLEEFNGR